MRSCWGHDAKMRGFLCVVIERIQIENMEPKHIHTTGSDSSSSIFLTGAILFANMDYGSLGEYALKAAIGGAIWMAFKVTSDYISERIKNRKK